MTKLLDNLVKIISKQTDLYRLLLDILLNEHEIILSSSVEELGRNNKKKEVVILQIKLLDESCCKVVEKAKQDFHICRDSDSISNILDSLDGSCCLPAWTAYARLVSLAHEVKRLNIENESLIKGSLRAIKSSMSFLVACASASNSCYVSSGQMRSEQVTMSLLNEEA